MHTEFTVDLSEQEYVPVHNQGQSCQSESSPRPDGVRFATHRERLVTACAVCLWLLASRSLAADDNRPIKIVAPRALPAADIPAERTPLGIANDYKPWIAQLTNGELLVVAFCFGPVEGEEGYIERAVFWRSADGGETWGEREERLDIHGREFALNVLSDGTILMPCHFLVNDAYNQAGYTYSKLFRSTDHGANWTETRIGPEGFPDGANTATDWTVVELPGADDLAPPVVLFGVSMQHGGEDKHEHVRLWRSTDSGETWDKSLHPDTDGWADVDGFFSQSTTHRTRSGRLLHPVRVDRTGPHWHIAGSPEELKEERGDNGDRMMLWESTDDGRTWRKQNGDGRFGYYGEMYPRFLQLQDGRLMLTFTVRSNSTDGYPLGVRAIFSGDDGRTWDFERDRLVISYVNHGASGGGFGNTIQLDDGTLVSVYSYRREDEKTYVETVRWRAP